MSGFQIPRAPGRDNRLRDVTDPFVELQVQGVRDDCSTRRTRIVRDNGLHPGTASTMNLFSAFSDLVKLCYSYLYLYVTPVVLVCCSVERAIHGVDRGAGARALALRCVRQGGALHRAVRNARHTSAPWPALGAAFAPERTARPARAFIRAG